MQIKKPEIRDRIRDVALDEFFVEGYKNSTMRTIARKADIPVALIYTYYSSKEDLLDEIVRPVLTFLETTFARTLSLMKEDRMLAEKEIISVILQSAKEWVILIDKSDGSKYQGMKDIIVTQLSNHINTNLQNYYQDYDPMYAQILAGCYMESVLTVARHYKDKEWGQKMARYIMELLFYRAARKEQ